MFQYMRSHQNSISFFLTMGLILSSCTEDNAVTKKTLVTPQNTNQAILRSDYRKSEIADLCKESIAKARQRLDAIVAVPDSSKTVDNTLLAFENTSADLSDQTTPLTFMGYVSTDKDISAEGSACETDVGQFNVEIMTRRDLYLALVQVNGRNEDEKRLQKKTIESFEQNGLKLSDELLSRVRDLKGQIAENETKFSTNLNTDKTTVLFNADELEGLPADYLADLKKNADGKITINTKESD